MHQLHSFSSRSGVLFFSPSSLRTQLLAPLKTMCFFFFMKCPHEVEYKMATVLIRRAHAVNCVEQSVPLGDKRRPGTLVPDEKKIGEREFKEGGGNWGGAGAVF